MFRQSNRLAPSAATLLLGFTLSVASGQGPADPLEGYRAPDRIIDDARALAVDSPRCAAERFGTSAEGRELIALVLSDDPATASTRPALLIVAGLDAGHAVGPEVALRVARRLRDEHAALLEETTVYVLPLINPDGAVHGRAGARAGHVGTIRPVDEDRDGRLDEDGPRDLDGDGWITTMRRPEPPLGDAATHLADPAEPRLLRTPNSVKGERAVYSIYREGLDDDGDGRIAEDGPGGVDLDKNFMHEWPEYDLDSGAYQLSEPESAALAAFVLAHRNIVAAVTYGRHDNLVNVPDGKGKDVSKRGPKVLNKDDVSLYKEIAGAFKEHTDQTRAPKNSTDGSFHVWLSAQRGIPSFATVLWGRPDASDPEPEPEPEPETETSDDLDPGDLDTPEDEDEPGLELERGDEHDEEDVEPADTASDERPNRRKDKKNDTPDDADAAAWLTYSDRDRDGAGFAPWTPFDHPTLGPVEIGGFIPGFRANPPADELDGIAEAQAAFAVDLLGRRPRLSIVEPTVERLAPGLYEIRFGLVNDGGLPTTTAMARAARAVEPTVVRLEVGIEQVLAGERVTRVNGIDGGGARWEHRWIVRAEDGAPLEIRVSNPQLGDRSIRFTADTTLETTR